MQARFGPFVLNTTARELTRDGEPLPLSPKAFLLLETLVARRPDVVAKTDLMQILWPETYVVEANLSNLVGEVRAALGEDRRRPFYVRTLHRRGYAFRDPATDSTGPTGPLTEGGLLLVWSGGAAPLAEGVHVVGRDPSLQIPVASLDVSRRHFEIHVKPGEVVLRDLGSRNGTWLNGEKVEGDAPLADGDEILAGSLRFVFRA